MTGELDDFDARLGRTREVADRLVRLSEKAAIGLVEAAGLRLRLVHLPSRGDVGYYYYYYYYYSTADLRVDGVTLYIDSGGQRDAG